jgi:uncharacterized membrane protein
VLSGRLPNVARRMSILLDSTWGRLLSAFVLIVAICTAVGVLVLWPGEDPDVELGPALGAGTEVGEVSAIEAFPCAGVQTDTCRRVDVAISTGPDSGATTAVETGTGGLDPELAVGDQVRVAPQVTSEGEQTSAGAPLYTLADFERRAPMLWLVLAFAALVVVFGRLRGALSLVGLAASLTVVTLFIVPAILAGEPPLAVAIVGALAVMFVTIPLAHGLGPKGVAAMLGTSVSLLLTAALAALFTEMTHLTGLASEETTLLQLNGASFSPEGLLLAGMVIGALGVLDDMTVSQASTVMALRAANPSMGARQLLGAGLRVGRDHVSATVNTLVLAYVGAALPVLLIFSSGATGFAEAANFEIVAAEIVATLVGSIGLIAAAPITTALAAAFAVRLPAARVSGPEAAAHVHA